MELIDLIALFPYHLLYGKVCAFVSGTEMLFFVLLFVNTGGWLAAAVIGIAFMGKRRDRKE